MTISATTQGLRPEICTSTSRPSTPFDGMMIYETDTNLVRIWNGTAWKTLAYSDHTNGGVLQTVQTTWTSVQSSSTDVWTDVTSGSLSITPSSSSNTVLCLVRISGCEKSVASSSNALSLRLLRGATTIAYLGDRIGFTNSALRLIIGTASLVYLDSPATTSSTTYKVQMRSYNNSASVSIGIDNPNDTHSITLMEIAG